MKKKNTEKKLKEIKLTMEFNPGKLAFEPVLPVLPIKKFRKSKWTRKKS
jgi:hypothetical protein